MNRPTRVMVANKPRLMRELVLETINQERDIEIVGEIETESDIPQVVEKLRPDFLIIALDETDKRPPICDVLLMHYPDMKIVTLAAKRNARISFWASFDIHEKPVEASEAGILDVPHGIEVRDKVGAFGEPLNQLELNVSARLADADSIILSESLQQLDALTKHAVPVVSMRIFEFGVLGAPHPLKNTAVLSSRKKNATKAFSNERPKSKDARVSFSRQPSRYRKR